MTMERPTSISIILPAKPMIPVQIDTENPKNKPVNASFATIKAYPKIVLYTNTSCGCVTVKSRIAIKKESPTFTCLGTPCRLKKGAREINMEIRTNISRKYSKSVKEKEKFIILSYI